MEETDASAHNPTISTHNPPPTYTLETDENEIKK